MDSSSGMCKETEATEPKVGILLDLGSPFNDCVVKSNSNCPDEAEPHKNAASALVNEPGDDPEEKHIDRGPDEESTETKSSLDRGSPATRNGQASDWSDMADEHLIDNEQFDFDLPVSPVEISSKVDDDVDDDDEDEVFFGPVGFTESCVAKKTQLISQSPVESKPLSPLNVEQYLELFLEANKVAIELAGGKKSQNSSQGSEGEGCKSDKETQEQSNDGGSVAEQPLSDRDADIQAESTDKPTGLSSKAEARNFKRLVRRDMRSPRRGTYTISVSPANTPPPPHLPTAIDCVSKLATGKPEMIEFSAKGSRAQPLPARPQRESKLPVKGVRRSKLPMKASLRRAVPVPKSSDGNTSMTSTAKLLRKKISSPPKRKRLDSCESEDMISETSSVTSETLETPNLAAGIPKGKRPQPGSFLTKASSNLRSSGSHASTPLTGSALKKSNVIAAPANADAAGTKKAPAAKPSMLQQGSGLQRRTVQASRSLKLVKPRQQGSLQLTASKPQPLKAVAPVVKASQPTSTATPKKPAGGSSKQTVSNKPSLPSTPVHLEKKVVPKRLLSSSQSACKPTARSLSSSSVPTPQTKMVPPSTPSRSDSRQAPANAASARRRSGIPTPSRRSVASTSRSISTSSVLSNSSPMRFRGPASTAKTSSPLASPGRPKPGHQTLSKEGAIKLDLDTSPARTIKESPANGGSRAALETRTNVLEAERSAPAVGMLIDLNTEDEKLSKASVIQGSTRENKENLIDLL